MRGKEWGYAAVHRAEELGRINCYLIDRFQNPGCCFHDASVHRGSREARRKGYSKPCSISCCSLIPFIKSWIQPYSLDNSRRVRLQVDFSTFRVQR